MKSTIVPAQVTTVEDKIAGNLGLTQILLLVAPIFFGSISFVILPPFYNYAAYKLVIIGAASCLCALLAIRVRGIIMLFWLRILIRYNSRPTYYVFNKRSKHLRENVPILWNDDQTVQSSPATEDKTASAAATAGLQLAELIAQYDAQVSLNADKKGKLRVHITKVTGQSFSPAAD